MSMPDAPSILVDIGNTRIKWAYCPRGTACAIDQIASLAPSDPRAWQKQRQTWLGSVGCQWVVAGVHPERVLEFKEWLRSRNEVHLSIDNPEHVPLKVALPEPGRVGIDRLLNAVAANTLRPRDTPAIIADIGSAVTVDWLDENGVFGGGAIFPGFELMSKSLKDYTALLPLVYIDEDKSPPSLPALSTRQAVRAGLFGAVSGGVLMLAHRMTAQAGGGSPRRFVTGGDATLLLGALDEGRGLESAWRHVPRLTLEGLRLAAGARP